MSNLLQHPASVIAAALSIPASPIIWNIVARNEYRHHTITKITGDKYIGCYFLAAWIFFSSLYRDYLFEGAISNNKDLLLTTDPAIIALLALAGPVISVIGTIFVLTSMYKLGVTGTYLGDYFGIYMKERVVSFPFNVLEHPMYNGATMVFLGGALYQNSLVGALLSAWVFIVYEISSRYFEGPFTTYIYKHQVPQQPQKHRHHHPPPRATKGQHLG